MITLKKLATLPKGTKVRKCLRLLESFQNKLRLNQSIDKDYLEGLIAILLGEVDDPLIRSKLLEINLEEEILWPLSDALFLLQQSLNIERETGTLKRERRGRGSAKPTPFTLVLDRLRSPFNVGSIFRTAESFGVEQIYLVEPSAAPSHPRAMRSGRGCQEEIPYQSVEEGELIELLRGRPLFALESGGEAITTFEFPQEGVAIIGSEELGVSPAMLAAAERSLGRVTIPPLWAKGVIECLGRIWHTYEHLVQPS